MTSSPPLPPGSGVLSVLHATSEVASRAAPAKASPAVNLRFDPFAFVRFDTCLSFECAGLCPILVCDGDAAARVAYTIVLHFRATQPPVFRPSEGGCATC